MTPVLPAFSGHVPPSFKDKFPKAKLLKTNWGQGFNDVYILDASDPMFAEIGKKYIEAQTKAFGTDHFYSSDTFNENTPPTNDSTFLSGVSKKIFQSMTSADPKAVWVMQGWLFFNEANFWKPTQIKALLDAVPDNQMIILDLYSELHPVWNRTNSYYGKPWIWNMLQNFGGNVAMNGIMANIAVQPDAARRASKNMEGIGLTPEAIEQNPALYELMLHNIWMDRAIDTAYSMKVYLDDYATRRYGKSNAKINEAWSLLYRSVYGGMPRRGGTASIIVGRPDTSMKRDYRVDTLLSYDLKLLGKAWGLFMQSAGELKASDGFQYDIVDVTREVLANYANCIQPRIMAAYNHKDMVALKRSEADFLQLMDDMDNLLATRQDFLLGKWIHDARSNGITPKESNLYEFNARDLVTLWGDKNSPLHEYSNRQWAGLIKGFYKPRWEMFFADLNKSLINKTSFNDSAFQNEVKNWEWTWVNKHNPYPYKVTGNSVEVAKSLFAKYHTKIEAAYK